MNISAVILTGGRSVRMGQDKALLVYEKKRFIDRLADELTGKRAAACNCITTENREAIENRETIENREAIESRETTGNCEAAKKAGHSASVNDQFRSKITEVFLSAARKEDYSDIGLPVAADEYRGIGPIEGIRQSLYFAREEALFVCAVDMPFVRREMALYLADHVLAEHDACVFCDMGRIHPTCGIYRRSVLPVIEEMISAKRYGLMELLSQVDVGYTQIASGGFPSEAIANINTQEEYTEHCTL